MVIIRRIGVSDGARALKDALNAAGIRAILSDRGSFERLNRTIINWGAGHNGGVVFNVRNKWLNKPEAINIARNKLSTFQQLEEVGVRIPKWWNQKAEVQWARKDSIILERHTLTGESGAGIVVKRYGEELSPAPLYVEYIRKQDEYRVHVFNGRAIVTQQKRRESDSEQSKDQALLRNRDNGWVFCVQDINQDRKAAVEAAAVAAVAGVGLDFGAVDIIVASRDDLPYVLEINTKPGLSSPTVLAAYVAAIQELVNERLS